MSHGVLTRVHQTTEHETPPADHLSPMALGLGDVSARVLSFTFSSRRGKFVIWFGLGFRVWGYRVLNVPEKQNSGLLQFTILPKLTLQLPLSAEHLQGWFLRARATFIPEERLTQSRDATELERNHDVNHQTTLVPNSSATCSHSAVLRAGTTSLECSVLQTLTGFFSPLFLLWENHLEDLSSPSRSY